MTHDTNARSLQYLFPQRALPTGIFEALVGVLRGNPTDRGAISLSCESIVCLVGVTFMFGPTLRLPRLLAFDPAIQAKATEAGILEAWVGWWRNRLSAEPWGFILVSFSLLDSRFLPVSIWGACRNDYL